MPEIHTILHPTDFSENSRYAFETACALARDNQATLLVLHVMVPSSSPVLDEPPPDPSRPADSLGSTARFPWPQASDPRIRLERRLAEGDPATEVLRLAEAARCDLIVLGTHGRTGLGRLLTGSVAEEVLRKADCPVLVVKAPLRAAKDQEAEATASPGDVINVRPLGPALASAQTRSLLRTGAVEVVRLRVRAGEEIPRHTGKGEILVQCLEGRVAVTALGKTETLESGTLLVLPAGEPHRIQGIEDASLLLTALAPRS